MRIDACEADQAVRHLADLDDLFIGINRGIAAGRSVDRQYHSFIDGRYVHLEQHHLQGLKVVATVKYVTSCQGKLRVPVDHFPNKHWMRMEVDSANHFNCV